MKHLHSRKGFTLIEILVFMALFSVILIVLTDLFSSTLQVRTESEATAAVQADASYIMARLMHDIAQASAVTVPSSLGGSGASLQITLNGINYSYALSGGNLTLTNNTGTNVLNGTDTTVSSLSFTRLGNGVAKDSVRFSYTVTSKASRSSGQESRTIQTTVGLR